jgi:predicted metal-dependent hydrolase
MRLIILLILIILILGVFYWYNYGKMTYIKSPIDNNFYMVRDLSDKYTAVNLLATMRLNIIKLKDHLNSKKNTDYKEYKQYIEQLSNRINDVTISESRGNEDVKDENGENKEIVTSYSVNKGEELVFCLRSRKEMNIFHTINILMYVILHEISHIACPEYGHGSLFKKIFAFFTKTAMSLKIYEYDDYSKSPKEYCGIYLNDSIV